ncbi:MAG: glycosyltransferase [Gemmatimonadetes bacterium]|nr:glycosyltransferase [Gemmatimonadota bacterium]
MHVVNLTAALNSGRFRSRLIAGRIGAGEGDMSYYARERGVEVFEIPELGRPVKPWDDVIALRKLYGLFRDERPTIVHTHASKAGALGRLAARATGVPIRIHTFHGHVLRGGYFSPVATGTYHRIERLLARITTRIVVLTEGQAEELSRDLRVAPREKFVVVPLGLELGAFASVDREMAGRTMRRELGIPEEEAVIGMVGRVTAVKRHELLFDAVRSLEARLARRIHILVVGDGERREALERYCGKIGLRSRVHWLAWRRDLPGLYAAMDVLALTSRNEGTPVAVIEALASGTAVVATSVGGVPEVLERGRWGVLVAAADAQSFADGLERVLERPPTADLRAAMQRSATARYGVERLVRDIVSLYERELKAAGLGGA